MARLNTQSTHSFRWATKKPQQHEVIVKTQFQLAACLPVALSLISWIRKLLSPGLRKQEAESSTDHWKGAENYGGYGPVVHGQHVDQRREQATSSTYNGAQTRGCLSETETYRAEKFFTLKIKIYKVTNIGKLIVNIQVCFSRVTTNQACSCILL